ncbi:MoaA/NifB/PqqE/SkfB family radical SAM enzyme [Crossiella equi]|uniref:MoaA/NifB/PqqE/SkfB family radical SAM enzyme n=1 Tax=Crossiella equi TaxID=130796 RepID=A0ABS5AS96_9PSEU|nr:radical SAM protein [Crossiella equi]MBP2479431.1 MoaA/NifB/PqqE/SkfB family radical SAM enzyme [Crossiella equi]
MTTTETTAFLWLYLTDKCQQRCTHCATGSSPEGTHGTMTTEDWHRVLTQAAESGVHRVQFVGGEPTLHPDLGPLINHALALNMSVEVFSNLVWIPERLWPVLERPGVSLATSYYSDDEGEHAGITGARTLARIRTNLAEARRRAIPVRAGVIDHGGPQRLAQARWELADLGVEEVAQTRVRELGRAAPDGRGCAAELCGACGDGVAAIGPDGEVRPCLFAKWVTAGHVTGDGLDRALATMPRVRAGLIAAGMPATTANACPPSGDNCWPHNAQ